MKKVAGTGGNGNLLFSFVAFNLLPKLPPWNAGAPEWTESRYSMKEWAKAFYLSKAWERCRDAYLESQNNICERCGEPAKIGHHKIWLTKENINNPYITLCWDNLEALCQDCHNKEHHKQEPKLRYSFDAEGNIIYNTPLSS